MRRGTAATVTCLFCGEACHVVRLVPDRSEPTTLPTCVRGRRASGRARGFDASHFTTDPTDMRWAGDLEATAAEHTRQAEAWQTFREGRSPIG